MRLVPETNTQKPSAPRLHYKTFVGARPARSRRRMNRMSEPMQSAKSEPEWAAFAAIDWADQKHFWRLAPCRQRATGTRGIGEHAGSGGGLGRSLAAAVWRPPHRRLFGAGARDLGLYADQVRAPGAVPGAPHYGGALPGDLLSVGGQGRSRRHGLVAGPVDASSRTSAPTAAGHGGNPPDAVSGGRAEAHGE